MNSTDFVSEIVKDFPDLENQKSLVSENLISPFTVKLPRLVFTQAQQLVHEIFSLRQSAKYQQYYKPQIEQKKLIDPGNYGFAMSYDLHWHPSQSKIKLIEINTNAAFLFLSEYLYRSHRISPPISSFSLNVLLKTLQEEIQTSGRQNIQKISILDANPASQRLYIEFLVAQKFFESQKISCAIQDINDFKEGEFDIIYNRFTDFYFEEPGSSKLRSSFLNQKDVFSPNPYEYFMLADKQRMIDWQTEEFKDQVQPPSGFLDVLANYVPRIYGFDSHPKEVIWQERKEFFFKPKNSFGSKQSFRGGSISRKAFDELNPSTFLRQEFIPADEITYNTPEGPLKLKYDLRVFAYRGEIQNIVARLYQGQVTNLQTKYGGFACVEWLPE